MKVYYNVIPALVIPVNFEKKISAAIFFNTSEWLLLILRNGS